MIGPNDILQQSCDEDQVRPNLNEKHMHDGPEEIETNFLFHLTKNWNRMYFGRKLDKYQQVKLNRCVYLFYFVAIIPHIYNSLYTVQDCSRMCACVCAQESL